jgi:hypothetical protein
MLMLSCPSRKFFPECRGNSLPQIWQRFLWLLWFLRLLWALCSWSCVLFGRGGGIEFRLLLGIYWGLLLAELDAI